MRLGRITPHTVDNLKIIQQFLGITFKITPDEHIEEEEEENKKDNDDDED